MRLIDADALRQRMYHEVFETDTDMQKWDSGCWIRYKLFENCIESATTISPDEVRGVGEWICDPISAVSPVEEWYCNICKQPAPMGYGKAYVRTNYCPSCGAKMEVSEDA